MSESFHEFLSAMDRQFLEMETPSMPMHVSGVSAYDLGPLGSEEGNLDLSAIRKLIDATLEKIPRYRQKLAWTPLEKRPLWVDDPDFDLDFHLKHLALPTPGSEAQLKSLTSWIVSQPLDRSRPLWEMWFLEGLSEGKQFAVVTKMHHCMLDGGAGVNLMGLLLRASPQTEIPESKHYEPRPAPSAFELAAAEVERRLSTPLRILRGARRFQRDNPDLPAAFVERVRALRDMLGNALPGSSTPINGELRLERCVDWMETPLEETKRLRRRLGCSLNDMALAIVTGALRRYFIRRGLDLEGLDFRASIPVDVRREDERGEMGNRISSWIVRLPLDETDPLEQLATLTRTTQELKGSHQELAVEMMMAAAEEVPLLLSLSARAAHGRINIVVTNVPGPPIPLYLMGCRALTMQPFVLLPPNVGLTVALLSYDGNLFWGFMGDAERVPDIARFRDDMRESLKALEEVAPEA